MYLYIWLCVLIAALWLYTRKKYSYFKNHQVNYVPIKSLYASFFKTIFKMEHMVDNLNRIYFTYPEDRFVGNYEFNTPVVMIRDPELIRLIGVKEFEHFSDHRGLQNEGEPFFSKSLIGLKGQLWREMRSTLSPAFTGSKLRGMVPLIQDCTKNLVRYLHEEISKNGYIDVDTKDLFARYTNDVIATCAFGLKVDSITERDNEFYKAGHELTNLKFKQMMKMIFVLMVPKKIRLIEINILPKKAMDFLSSIVLDTMKNRNDNKVFRPDLIQILIEAKKGTLKHENVKDEKDAGFATVEESAIGKEAVKRVWDDEYLVAQALLFFFAGFDTVSTALMFLLHELVVNPDVQTKLRREIDEYYNKYQGQIDYDKINQMKYMDMVLSETLRKWPPAPVTDRLCQKRYNLGKPHDKATKDFYIKEGHSAYIPIWPIHYDPKYYPEPQRFDPERFSDDNKHNIKPFTYLPFGVGPRNCIGSRFAIIEVKAMVFDLLRHFELSPGPKTQIPIKLDLTNGFTMRIKGGGSIRIHARSNTAA